MISPLDPGPVTGRLRKAVEMTAPRLAIRARMSSSAVVPPCIPMMTNDPSRARAEMLRCRYFAPIRSMITSAPRPSVASIRAATKSVSA